MVQKVDIKHEFEAVSLQASMEIINVDSTCKQAKSGLVLIILGPKNAVPILWIAKILNIFKFS